MPGIDPRALRAADQAGRAMGGVLGYHGWPFVFIPEIMTPPQRRRLAQQVRRYIAPYNREVFAHHGRILNKERERWERLLKR